MNCMGSNRRSLQARNVSKEADEYKDGESSFLSQLHGLGAQVVLTCILILSPQSLSKQEEEATYQAVLQSP